jgi:hypothetical protein
VQLSFVSDPAIPVITSSDSAILTHGTFFSYTFTADANATFSYIGIDGVKNGALPPGLSFDGIATISGTYTGAPSPGGIVRRAADSTSNVGTDTITIRPPLIGTVQLIAESLAGTTTAPLNFLAGPANLMASQPPDMTMAATGPSGAVVTFASPVVTDASGNNLTVTCVPSSGSMFPFGPTTVVCTSVPDSSGAFAVVTFKVTVQDKTPPMITSIPTSITVGAAKAAKGQPQGATVSFSNQLAAVDAVDGAVTPVAQPPSGSFFPMGSTTVTVTATDSHGNSTSKTFAVVVQKKAPKAKAGTVTVTVNPTSIHQGQSATFTVSTTSANPSAPLIVAYQMSGTATPPSQYYTLSGSGNHFVIPSGATSATVTLSALPTMQVGSSETATMTLQAGSGYKLGKSKKGSTPAGSQVTVTINNP